MIRERRQVLFLLFLLHFNFRSFYLKNPNFYNIVFYKRRPLQEVKWEVHVVFSFKSVFYTWPMEICHFLAIFRTETPFLRRNVHDSISKQSTSGVSSKLLSYSCYSSSYFFYIYTFICDSILKLFTELPTVMPNIPTSSDILKEH